MEEHPEAQPLSGIRVIDLTHVTAWPVLHEKRAYADPHLKEQGFFVPITPSEAGTHLYPSATFKMSKASFRMRKHPVRLWEDNDYVYRKVLGLSKE